MIREFQGEYRWLSNFWPCRVVLDGAVYPSVEHAYQAAKTTDPAERARIRVCATPGEAKRMGRTVKVRPDWDQVKVEVMRGLLQQKFAQEPFRSKLLATGGEELVEGNRWHDRFWGRCVCPKCGGTGQNWLGRLIMEVRAELRTEAHVR